MRMIARLRSIEREDGSIVMVGSAVERIEPGSRLMVSPTATTSDEWQFDVYASDGPRDKPQGT